MPLGGTPPGFATNPSPANNGENIPPDVVLSWNPPDDPVTSYSVKVYNQAEVLVFEASVPAPQTTASCSLDYDQQYQWVVDPVNDCGSASDLGNPPAWFFQTLPAVIQVDQPGNQATGVNPHNRLLDWNPLPGALAYKVSAGTTPGGTDLINNAGVVTTQYLHVSDWPENSTVHWSVSPERGTWAYPPTSQSFATGGLPPVNIPMYENFDSTTPPAMPPQWKTCTNANYCGAGVQTLPGIAPSPPNYMLLNNGGDPSGWASATTPPINLPLRHWKSTVSFYAKKEGANPTELLVESVSDQGSQATVYSSQTVTLTDDWTNHSVQLPMQSAASGYVRIKTQPGVNAAVDNLQIYLPLAQEPQNFQIVRQGSSTKLTWPAADGYCAIYRVYTSDSPNGLGPIRIF